MPKPDFWEYFSRGIAEVAKEYDHRIAHYAWDMVPIAIGIVDSNDLYLHVNKAYRDTLGYDLDELVGVRSFWDLTAPESTTAVRHSIQSRDTFGHFGWMEKSYIHKDGSHVPCRIRGHAVDTARSGKIVIAVLDFF